MKKLFALASLALLPFTAGAVESIKPLTSSEVLVASCETLSTTWRLIANGRKPITTPSENVQNGHCYGLLNTTLSMLELASDSEVARKICKPDTATNRLVLGKVLPILRSNQKAWAGSDDTLMMVVALQLAYPCKGTNL